jgi:pilus assembly protein FimV
LSETAIQGVDVEIDDEDEEELALAENDGPAPALSFAVDDSDNSDDLDDRGPAPAFQEEEHASLKPESSSFVEEAEEKSSLDFSQLDKDIVLQGVEVETEADDDSDEEALPMMGGELAPALAENDETSIYNAEIFESAIEENIEAEISGTLGGFFDEEIESHETVDAQSAAEPSNEKESTIASAEDAGPKPTVGLEDEGETIAFASPSEQDDLAEEVVVADGDSAPGPEVDAEIDEHLDSFFGFEEGVEELAEDELLYSEPGEPSGNIIIAEDEAAPPPVEDTAEEVVFELVEEDNIVFSTLSSEDNSGDAFTKEFTLTPDVESLATVYQSLHASVEALGYGFEDKIIGDARAEIDRLYQELSDRPLEKTFLQLMSPLIRHIDKNRHDANGDAYVLLKSVCSALIELDDNTSHKNQEMLLTETGKVLEWQESLLVQQMVTQ